MYIVPKKKSVTFFYILGIYNVDKVCCPLTLNCKKIWHNLKLK